MTDPRSRSRWTAVAVWTAVLLPGVGAWRQWTVKPAAVDAVLAWPSASLAAERVSADSGMPYLVAVADPPALEIRARGLTLHSVPVASITLHGPLPEVDTPLRVPAVWVVARRPPGAARTWVTPGVADPPQAGQPPARFTVDLDDGWSLTVVGGDEPTASGRPARGRRPPVRRVVWRLGEDDARSLHHLFRNGTRIHLTAVPLDPSATG